MHVGVRLLHLVEQHDAVRAAAHGLGQHAALAVAHVARRRALERGHRVRLLVLAHVDGDHVLLAAVERLGERQRGLRLADARRADQHEHADGLARVVELRARRLDALGDGVEAVALADHAPVERVGELEHALDFVLHHAADRDAGPVRDDRGDGLLVDRRQDQRALALQRDKLRFELLQLAPAPWRAPRATAAAARPATAAAAGGVLRCAGLASAGASFGVSTGELPARSLARRSRMPSTIAFSSPQRASSSASRVFSLSSSPCALSLRSATGDADRFLAPDDRKLGVERLDPAARSPRRRAASRAGSRPRARTRCRAGSRPCPAAAAPGCSGATA